MKYIIVSEYRKNFPNSVSEILTNMCKIFALNNISINIYYPSNCFEKIIKINDEYLPKKSIKKNKLFSILIRFDVLNIFSKRYKSKCLQRIIDREKPNKIIFLLFNPDITLGTTCTNNRVPFVQMFYDTYITRPYIKFNKLYQIESKVISMCEQYLVPSFFYNDYLHIYNNKKVIPYYLPLLVEKDLVMNSLKKFSNSNTKYNFSYFGQIQDFRNYEDIKLLIRKCRMTLDIFTVDNIKGDNNIIIHEPLIGQKLYDAVALSKFLVIFDNNFPYNHYLPSKVFLYISFGKPIVIFGNNHESALIEFLKEYSCVYYQKIDGDYEGLINFIVKHSANENIDNSKKYNLYSFGEFKKFIENNIIR